MGSSISRLVLPSIKYKRSFLQGLKEVEKEKSNDPGAYKDFDHDWIRKDFPAFVKALRGRRKGIGLPKGYVPDSILWLVDGTIYLGHVSIRHRLTPHLRTIGGHIGYSIRPTKRKKGYGTLALKLALPIAKKLGIKRVRITCDATNVGSRKIIEKNGGTPDGRTKIKGEFDKLLFWIRNN